MATTAFPESEYDHYTLGELEDALAHLDRATYPERAAELAARIAERTEAEFSRANTFVPLESTTRRRSLLQRILLPSAELTFHTPLSAREVNASLAQAFADGREGLTRSIAVLRYAGKPDVQVALQLLVTPGQQSARLSVVGTGRSGFWRVEYRAYAELSLQEAPHGCVLTLRVPSTGVDSVSTYAMNVYLGTYLIGMLIIVVYIDPPPLPAATFVYPFLAFWAGGLVWVNRRKRRYFAPLRDHIVSFLRADLLAEPTKMTRRYRDGDGHARG